MRTFIRAVVAAGVMVTGSAAAFTQKTPLTSIGHEAIIVQAGQRIPNVPRLTASQAGCRFCDDFGTDKWRLWSAVIGNRWADFSGYNVVTEVARAKLHHRKTDCFDAVAQDGDVVQYQHALRARCDSGVAGLRNAYTGTVSLIRARFLAAVAAGDEPILVRDGGLWVGRYTVDHAYFLLGLALHALQDSFSEEHAVRSPDGRRIKDLKTYVDTPNAPKHCKPGRDRDKYAMFGYLPQPTPLNGDYVFNTTVSNAWGNAKRSADNAMKASADLMDAFLSAKLDPSKVNSLWSAFEDKWLLLDPSVPTQDGGSKSPKCADDSDDTESTRRECLRESGLEVQLPEAYPPFCWPASRCALSYDDLKGVVARDATAASNEVLGGLDASVGTYIAGLHVGASETPDDFGAHAADGYINFSLQEEDLFFLETGDSFPILTKEERTDAVRGPWERLIGTLDARSSDVRDRACSGVAHYDGDAARACRSAFDRTIHGIQDHSANLYAAHLSQGLSGQDAIVVPVVISVMSSSMAIASAEIVPFSAASLSPFTSRSASSSSSASSPPSPPASPSSASATAPLQPPPPPPPPAPPSPVTGDSVRRARLYDEFQQCVRDPVGRLYDPLDREKSCRKEHSDKLRAAGLPE